MSTARTPLLFVHGYWHGSWCWSEVIAHAASAGRTTLAVDLAGHGLRAQRPASANRRPFNPEALATEVSPVAGVDLDEAGELLLAQVKQFGGGGPVTIVAHSMGGTVLTRAAQQAPELVAHAVYLTAFMPASDIPAIAYIQMPENAGELVVPLLQSDPNAIGALRLDTASTDVDYHDGLRNAFYGDVDPVVADTAIALLTPDAPIGIGLGATTLTREGWGAIPRTYVTCARDMVVRPPLQQKFITDADTAFPDNPTSVVALDASHSPFLSTPVKVAEAIAKLG
jgi:pimeloyl-ACP methyl ester carboxylesterase